MIDKNILIYIIKNKGSCDAIACTNLSNMLLKKCPLFYYSICEQPVSDKSNKKHLRAINLFIKEYGVSELVEILL